VGSPPLERRRRNENSQGLASASWAPASGTSCVAGQPHNEAQLPKYLETFFPKFLPKLRASPATWEPPFPFAAWKAKFETRRQCASGRACRVDGFADATLVTTRFRFPGGTVAPSSRRRAELGQTVVEKCSRYWATVLRLLRADSDARWSLMPGPRKAEAEALANFRCRRRRPGADFPLFRKAVEDVRIFTGEGLNLLLSSTVKNKQCAVDRFGECCLRVTSSPAREIRG